MVNKNEVKMPKRTREHKLENESRKAFEGVIPSDWVYRQLPADYGIDGEVGGDFRQCW